MEFILGLLSAVVLFVVYMAGVKDGRKKKAAPIEVDEESEKRAKELYEDFQALMNYDMNQAMKRKQVL